MAQIRTETLQTFIYAALTVLSLGVMGLLGETCDVNDTCTGRGGAVVAFAIFAALVSMVMLAAYAYDLEILKRLEIFFVLALLLFVIVETAVVTSPRTVKGTRAGDASFAVELAWWSLLFALAALFLASASDDHAKFDLPTKAVHHDTPAQPLHTGYGSQDGTMSSHATPSYTGPPPPQPGGITYTTPPNPPPATP